MKTTLIVQGNFIEIFNLVSKYSEKTYESYEKGELVMASL